MTSSPVRFAFRAVTAAAVTVTVAAGAAGTAAAQTPPRPVAGLPARLPDVLGDHLVTVVLVEPVDGNRERLDEATAAAIVDGADRIWAAESAGKIRVRLDRVVPWTPTTSPRRCHAGLAVDIAAQIGWTATTNRHLVVIEPTGTCELGGAATLRGPWVWVGWQAWVGTTSGSVVLAHELGHNFGLTHTSAAGCSAAFTPVCPLGDELAAGRGEYGGDDLMGDVWADDTRTLNPIARWQLGLLDADQIVTVDLDRPGTRTVSVTTDAAGPQVVRLVSAAQRASWWVDLSERAVCGDARIFACASPAAANLPTGSARLRVYATVGPKRWARTLQQPLPDDTGTIVRTLPTSTLTVTVDAGTVTVTVAG